MTARAVITLQSPVKSQSPERLKARAWVTNCPPGTRIEFRAPRRTVPQNDLLWGILTDISKQVVWYGEKLPPEDWKDMLTAALKKTRVMPGINGGFVLLGLRTSNMSKEEFSDLLELAMAFGAEKNVIFSHLLDNHK